MINYEDFAKIEIRIGEVKSVDLIEGADKLLRCMVDVGDIDAEGNPTNDGNLLISNITVWF